MIVLTHKYFSLAGRHVVFLARLQILLAVTYTSLLQGFHSEKQLLHRLGVSLDHTAQIMRQAYEAIQVKQQD